MDANPDTAAVNPPWIGGVELRSPKLRSLPAARGRRFKPFRPREIDMNKTLTALLLAAFAFTAQAASHAGAAPAKAEAAKPAASAAKKAEMKKEEKKTEMKKEAKKEEAKK
jgi:hypothetical protein